MRSTHSDVAKPFTRLQSFLIFAARLLLLSTIRLATKKLNELRCKASLSLALCLSVSVSLF